MATESNIGNMSTVDQEIIDDVLHLYRGDVSPKHFNKYR